MGFNRNKFKITRDYIKFGNARSGAKIPWVGFFVAHDIGNGGSTARQNRAYFNDHQPSASAHTFIDDKEILEIIPINEKAWHVRYDVPLDNIIYGDDANDIAIGTELCHGPKINFEKAYEMYVWYHAYLCDKFGKDPRKDIIDHAKLDPGRRSDPHNALNKNGKTYAQFINDVVKELNGGEVSKPVTKPVETPVSKPSTGGLKELPNTVNQIRIKDTAELRKEGLHTYSTPNWTDKTGPMVKPNYVFTVKRKVEVDGSPMYQLVSGWYITASDKFVEEFKASKPEPKPVPKPEPKPEPKPKPSYVGKRVKAKVDLRFYRKPSWGDKDVAGTCKKGLGFTILDKVKVDNAEQYKVRNSKGDIYYITASSKYVTVK